MSQDLKEVLQNAKMLIDDMAALIYREQYSLDRLKEAMLRVNVAAVADVLQQIGDVLKLVDAAPDLERIRKWANSPEEAQRDREHGYEAARTWVRDVGLSALSDLQAGFVSVPVKPTEEMVDAGNAADYAATTHRPVAGIYRAMLAAAPKGTKT